MRRKRCFKGKLGFEYAEHCFIGDTITLTLASGGKVAASDYRSRLKDQLSLTYGLAGDFYGTYDPISDGKNDQDRSARFVRAYNTLADGGPRLPKEAMDILAVLQAEVDAVNVALANHQDPSVVYAKLELITFGRSGIPAYLGLAQINWDHFGADARTAYNARHSTAIQKVISGDLDGAYAMNTFADHFLEDSFSAGHLRTPRRLLHNSPDITADACAKYMHDEDNAIGIDAKNPAVQSWTLHSDKRALDSVNEDNKTRCVDSMQASANEIYQTKQAPSPANYQAWTFAPTLESANAHQTLATLFTFKNEKRKVIENRKLWNLSPSLPRGSPAVVYFRMSIWTGCGVAGPARIPSSTPLAAINFNGGKEVGVPNLLHKARKSTNSASIGRWFPGELGGMKIQAATNTSIAAIQYGDDQGGVHIRMYCQELASDAIKELYNDGYWFRGATLPVALSGSSIAAVTYSWNGLQLRVYYQTDDLSIKEHCLNDNSPGKLDFGKAPGCVPISALGYGTSDGGAELHVYWRNPENQIVGTKNTGSWGPVNKVVGGLKPGIQFAAAQWSNGKNLRLYYQTADDSVLEMVNDGASWVGGASVGNAR
ncbi:fungal fucose-specific lectin-domain-containing protein [Armillaria borealis]|uniref:Fungal fucose-specific lectin-domain-containing protein n=1 Tax=Armillaria borealis TaxID=47425 RepID=A0AA39J4G2_9AGAR|nr:fungal fucose-specific lectin-domain-containing protein [Armillaria borealis]